MNNYHLLKGDFPDLRHQSIVLFRRSSLDLPRLLVSAASLLQQKKISNNLPEYIWIIDHYPANHGSFATPWGMFVFSPQHTYLVCVARSDSRGRSFERHLSPLEVSSAWERFFQLKHTNMKPRINASIFLVFLMVIAVTACDNKTKEDEAVKTDTTKSETNSIPGFDPARDPITTPGYPARVLADTLNLKAYEFIANPGDTIPAHEHPDHVIYVLEGGTAEIKAKDGTVQTAEFIKGACLISGPQGHSAKNTGATPIKLLIVHVYRPRS